MHKRHFLIIAVSILSAAGCGPIAWKQGSTTADLKRDETACRVQQPRDDGAAQCLRDKGWTITQFSAPGNAVTQTPAAAPTATSMATTAAEPAQPASETAAAPAAANVPTPNLQTKVNVQSWWKAGAQAADFNTDADSCQSALGAEHTPNYTERLYTNGFLQCLRNKGWHAGYNPVYTPLR